MSSDTFRMAGELATYLDPTGLSRSLWAIPRSFDLFQQLSGQSVTDENRPAGSRAILNKAPVIWDAENKRWIADRPEGYGAPLGGKPHVWSTERQEWVPMPGASTPEQTTTEPETSPDTTPPTTPESGSTPPAGTGVDTQAGTQGTQPSPEDVFSENRKLLEMLPGLMERTHQQELQRSLLTATLRDRGLRELSRRNIEQENIKAWAAVRTAQEQARSNQAISLANTAYLAQTPNVALGQMLNESMKSAMTPVQLYAPRG